jgi:hypothetical protein
MAGQCLARHKALHGLAQMVYLLVIYPLDLRQCSIRVGETGWGDEGGQVGHRAIVQRNKVKQK